MIKLDHVSDSHGYFPNLSPNSDVVVHSGDFLANFAKTAAEIVPQTEKAFQEKWLKSRLATIRDWLDGRTFIFSKGNHDFIDPCELLSLYGIQAINIDDKIFTWRGKSFYGFPYVPWIKGQWNNELATPEMKTQVDMMAVRMENHYRETGCDVDILVAHCPPYGILDNVIGFYSGHDGNTSLANHLTYFKTRPSYVFSGHFHDSAGIKKVDDMIVSNAATKVHTFEIE